MCGIAGIFGAADKTLMTKMLARMRHRGPDDIGIFVDDDVVLGHDRLSIIDVEKGHQPISNEDASEHIVVNGEIYNFQILKNTMSGHDFKTDSDSEVPLHLHEDLHDQTASRLDGMFALAIYDGHGLYLARDPLGIKPLYYGVDDGVLYFASEIKGLLEATGNVREFPPGSYCYVRRDADGIAPSRFSHIQDKTSRATSLDDAVNMIRQKLSEAVKKRLLSDVPLGTFLSGGVDSTIVTSLVAENLDRLDTFVTGMEGAPDLDRSRRAAEHLGVNHHEQVFTEEDVINHLEWAVYHLESFDAALIRSAIPTYFVSNLAKRYVKVVLTGEGADELFAGYHYFKGMASSDVHPELVRITGGLHNLNLQRCDRMTMAHSLEARVPFLDFDFVNYALPLPTELKLYGKGKTEKYVLRQAFKDLLPQEIALRSKQKFAEGTGSYGVVKDIAENAITDKEYRKEREKAPVDLRSKEELYCYRIFTDFFDNESVVRLLGRTRVY